MIAAATVAWLDTWQEAGQDIWATPSGWRVGAHAPFQLRLTSGTRTAHVSITGTLDAATVVVDDEEPRRLRASATEDSIDLVLDDRRDSMTVARNESSTWVSSSRGTWRIDRIAEPNVREDDTQSGDAEILSPMPGSIMRAYTRSKP